MEAVKTVKQKVIEMLQRLPEDIDYDRVVEHIYVMRRIEQALADEGDGVEHEAFMKELLGDDDEKSPGYMDPASTARP